jgi:hypothetical protein
MHKKHTNFISQCQTGSIFIRQLKSTIYLLTILVQDIRYRNLINFRLQSQGTKNSSATLNRQALAQRPLIGKNQRPAVHARNEPTPVFKKFLSYVRSTKLPTPMPYGCRNNHMQIYNTYTVLKRLFLYNRLPATVR